MGRSPPLVQTWCATPVPKTLFCLTAAILKSKRPPRACSKADPREIRGTFANLKRRYNSGIEFGVQGSHESLDQGGPPPHHALNRPQPLRSQGFTSRPRNIAKREFKNQNRPGAPNNSKRPLFRRERPHPPQRKAPSALRAPWGLALAASSWGRAHGPQGHQTSRPNLAKARKANPARLKLKSQIRPSEPKDSKGEKNSQGVVGGGPPWSRFGVRPRRAPRRSRKKI